MSGAPGGDGSLLIAFTEAQLSRAPLASLCSLQWIGARDGWCWRKRVKWLPQDYPAPVVLPLSIYAATFLIIYILTASLEVEHWEVFNKLCGNL